MAIEIETRGIPIRSRQKAARRRPVVFQFRVPEEREAGSLVFIDFPAPPLLSYGEAKKWARAKALELDAIRIVVRS